jgi:hypothetical protein
MPVPRHIEHPNEKAVWIKAGRRHISKSDGWCPVDRVAGYDAIEAALDVGAEGHDVSTRG